LKPAWRVGPALGEELVGRALRSSSAALAATPAQRGGDREILILVRELRCPVLVGRDAEVAHLLDLIDRAGNGGGDAMLVLGEAGVGKSRFTEAAVAAARSRGMAVLRGRAAPSPAPAPYRPLAEALLSAFRTRGALPIDDLSGFRAAFNVLTPGLLGDDGSPPPDPSLILLGEAILAVLRLLGGPAGVLLLLEDLHWADPGTLELLDYVLDKLGGTKAVVVATVRSGEASAAEQQARSLHARRQIEVVELSRLPPDDVVHMLAASLDREEVPPELVGVVQDSSEGLPFLVEEVLTSLVTAHSLVRDEEGWRVVGPLRRKVPPSFGAIVQQRMSSLAPSARSVVQAAAVLGERFDWTLLGPIAGATADETGSALRDAAGLQLVEEDPDGPGFRFRHGLTRAAVLATLLPPERAAWAGRALAELDLEETRDPERLELAARLAETAGNRERSVDLMLASAGAALDQGALSSSAASAERVLASASDPATVLRALEVLLDTFVQAGQAPRVAEVGRTLLARLEAGGPASERMAHVHLRLAESCVAATDWRGAEEHLSSARALIPPQDEALSARRLLLQARAALGQHRPVEAAEDVRAALDIAEERDLDDVRWESLELRGRVERALGLGGAERWFTQALLAAERVGARLPQVRALLELGIIDLFRLGSPERLRRAEALATDIGAPSLAAQASLHLSVLLSFRFQLDEARVAAQRAHDAAVRYQLGLLVPAAANALAAIHAYRGRRAEAVATFTREQPLMDVDNEVVGRQYLAIGALAVEDRVTALEEFRRAEALLPEASPITRSPFRPLLALLLALAGDDPAPLLGDLETGSDHSLPAALRELAGAVVAGQSGDPSGAGRLFARGDYALQGAPWFRMVGRRLVAESAVAGGWGAPALWLDEAHDFFTANGLEGLARGSRSLLRQVGADASPQRGEVEPELASIGVTRREAEVLALVGEGMSNKEIAVRLYLSPRTVEKHVERLLLKTGLGNRAQLAALATRLEGSRT